MKTIYLLLGIISFLVGTLGIFLPVLPTVPLYLLATFFLAKSSKKLHDKIVNSNMYQKHMKDYFDRSGIPLKKKIKIVLLSTSIMIISIIFCPNIYGKVIIFAALLLHIFIFFKRIPTKEE